MPKKPKKTDKSSKSSKSSSFITPSDVEILRWVQEGKTNEEIGHLIGKTKWTAKYHMKSIMQKLCVTSRAKAVVKAISMGLLPPTIPHHNEDVGPRMKLGLVGCGPGGTAVLNLFRENPSVTVEWVSDINTSAEGIIIARNLNIPTSTDYNMFLHKKIDVVINLTGSEKLGDELRAVLPPNTELMGGVSARIMWQLFEERRRRVEERERILKEHEALYHLGLVIESIDSLSDASSAILDYATKLTGTPAGSLAMFDDKRENMTLVAAKGFSSNFKDVDTWDIRKGGLTGNILNHNGPLYIEDIRKEGTPNSLLLKEGVRSLLAAPLTVEGRIVGILYVNDFKVRKFRVEDTSLFSLLTIYAGLTLERVKSLEEVRLLSITDGLTGLHNQRYLMEQLQKEVQRAGRHKSALSVIMFDIDYFKQYNDTYGHLEGNKVLKQLSKILKKHSRITDTVGRFGGEEFCIIMPQIKKKGAVVFGRRLLKEIEAATMPNRVITLSGGVASFPEDGKNHLSLLKKADIGLYKAKNDGRNKLCT